MAFDRLLAAKMGYGVVSFHVPCVLFFRFGLRSVSNHFDLVRDIIRIFFDFMILSLLVHALEFEDISEVVFVLINLILMCLT